MKLLLLLGSAVVLALGLTGSGAFAAQKETCSGPLSGAHGSITVQGTCAVVAPVTINGNLTVADGSVFVGFGPEVHITGNVKVGKGALFSLGFNGPGPDGAGLGPDTVGGNIVANQPLSLYIGNATVRGNVVSNGGGTTDRFYNFPVKDNIIGGNLVIQGWTGGWWGAIANTVGGNAILSKNRSVVIPENEANCEGTFPAGCAPVISAPDTDSSEVQSRFIPKDAMGPGNPPADINNPQHISGNLICQGNSPVAQINPGDGGAANIVDGNKIGQCAGL